MDSGEVVFLYNNDPNSGSKTMVPMPHFGCTVVVNVPIDCLPVRYNNDWVSLEGKFISNSGDSVSSEDLKSYDFPGIRGVCGMTVAVYILVPKKELVTAGVEMKEEPGFLWDDEEARFTEEPQPTPTSVWNSGLKRWDEACDIKGCSCGNLKSKMDWITDGPSWIEADFFSSLFDHYCSEDCHCDCCGVYYNPKTCAEKHAYPDEDAEVKRCSKPKNANYSKYRD